MKRKSVDAQFVAHLAEIAGFHFSAERAELLVPQLDWLLGEAQKIGEVLASKGILGRFAIDFMVCRKVYP